MTRPFAQGGYAEGGRIPFPSDTRARQAGARAALPDPYADRGVSGDIEGRLLLVKARLHPARVTPRFWPETLLVVIRGAGPVEPVAKAKVSFVLENLPLVLADHDEDADRMPRFMAVPVTGRSVELVQASHIAGYATWHQDLRVTEVPGQQCMMHDCSAQVRFVESKHPEERHRLFAVGCSVCSWVATRAGVQVVSF